MTHKRSVQEQMIDQARTVLAKAELKRDVARARWALCVFESLSDWKDAKKAAMLIQRLTDRELAAA